MRRRELKKAIKEYSNKTKFYKLGLVRELIQWKEKEYERLKSNIPDVVCPYCGSKRVEIDCSDDEYSCGRYLSCSDCCEWIQDHEEEYIKAYDEFDNFNFIDGIEMYMWGTGMKVTPGSEWNDFCEKEIKDIIGRG
ncbi:TPA: hypothetical protein ACOTG0_002083 [Clostridium perfringens]|nr:hypothetical protein phiCPD_00089 [Clostridium phage phiCp-D]